MSREPAVVIDPPAGVQRIQGAVRLLGRLPRREERGTFGGDRYAAYDWEKDDQETTARQAGRERGDDINLRPHLDGDDPERKKLL